LNSGHYYCYIRPGLEDKWFKFNDANVSEVSKVAAFNTGIGGYLSKFELHQLEPGYSNQNLEIEGEKKPSCSISDIIERRHPLPTQAYMLVYIREAERVQILEVPAGDSIPPLLRQRFDQEIEM